MKIVIGICGSIAAYKSLELIRILKKEGADVRVILTKSALHFVTPLSCQTLSSNEVFIDQFTLTKGIKHISLSQWADLLVVGPATANIIGKAACGIGDDLLSTTIMSFQKPVLFVPAMDTGMWQNKIVQENVMKLKKTGYHFLEPTHGFLASGNIGKGRFPHIVLIFKKIIAVLERQKSLAGSKFLISGGRTEEDLDTVRVITNRSSGRMAAELLYAVVCRDGQARGIFGETTYNLPEGFDVIRARTSKAMYDNLKKNMSWCDCLIMAAAVGDYGPVSKKSEKIHEVRLNISMKKNKDLLKELSTYRGRKLSVGFSLEDVAQLKRGKMKLVQKGLDFVVLNSINAIGREKINAKIMKKDGKIINVGRVSKWRLANKILDECVKEIHKKNRG